MEIEKQETAPRKPVSPYLIASGVIVLLAIVTFVAVKYMNRGVGGPMGDMERGGNLIPSGELPEAEPQTMGVYSERNDNIIIVAPADSIRIMAPGPNQEGEPKMEAD